MLLPLSSPQRCPHPNTHTGDDIGFANLPNQIHRECTKHGFEFSVMVAGESGLGKSTLINTLFGTDLFEDSPYGSPGERLPPTVEVKASTFDLEESGVKLRLTVVDTPGFGNGVNNDGCWEPLLHYIDQAFDRYMDDESHIERGRVRDGRVHCCLYFIAPNGHGLKPLDVHVLGLLQDKVNVIPVIAKADTLTADECRDFKAKILADIEDNGIKVYHFPKDVDDDEEEEEAEAEDDPIPLAVCAARTDILVGGKKVRGRQYPWGAVEIENTEHSDFQLLRNLLIRTHMHDLIDVTATKHYERFRSDKLSEVTNNDEGDNPMARFDKEREEHERKMRKMEAEMSQVFEQKVREKEKKLKDTEQQLLQRHEEMKKDLQQRQKMLEQRRADFEREKASAERERGEREAAKALPRTLSSLGGKKKGKLF